MSAPQNPLRVLHCPLMVGGNPQHLARTERELGLDSHAVVFRSTVYDYPTDEVLWPQGDPLWRFEVRRWNLLWRALREADVVHFNFGMSILPHWVPDNAAALEGVPPPVRKAYQLYARLFELRDLPWLKRAGKTVVVTYQGNDARQGDYCREHFAISPVSEVAPDEYPPELDRHKRWKIATFARYADRIYSLNPDLMHVLPPQTRFLPYAHIDLDDWAPIPNPAPAEVPVVLHAPSHRGMKGTRHILAAVERLKQEGVPFEFVLVEGLSHAEARSLYQRADLLIDQLLCGWYGGLATELMALGKPVICYLRDGDLGFIPEAMRQELPLIQAEPATIEAVLREWLTVRLAELAERGRMSRRFVERWHDPRKVAASLKADYEALRAAPGGRR